MILNIHNLRLVLRFHSTQSSRHLLVEGPQEVQKCSPEFKSRAHTVSSYDCLSTWLLLSVTTFLLAHPSTLAGSCWAAALPFHGLTGAHPSLRSPANFMSEHSLRHLLQAIDKDVQQDSFQNTYSYIKQLNTFKITILVPKWQTQSLALVSSISSWLFICRRKSVTKDSYLRNVEQRREKAVESTWRVSFKILMKLTVPDFIC